MAHVVDVQTQIQTDLDGNPTGIHRYRWRCSCGVASRRWQSGTAESGSHASAARRARNGGARHARSMERG